MFGNKKRLKEIEKNKQQLEKEKQELLFIKQHLEDSTPKIDISNIYVWEDKGIYSIVRLNVQNMRGRICGGMGRERDGFYSTLTDIFTNKIIYEKSSVYKINSKEYISIRSATLNEDYYAYLYPIYKIDNTLMAYADKKVPLYVLQQLYYKLNNVDVSTYTLKKENK